MVGLPSLRVIAIKIHRLYDFASKSVHYIIYIARGVNRLFGFTKVLLLMVGCVLAGAIFPAQAFISHITEDPTKLLNKYLSLDKKGVRLEAASWQVVQPYVTWVEEPAWGHVVVISAFHIVDDVSQWDIIGTMEARIPVTFDVLGTMHWESVTFVPDPHQESHFFHIKTVYDRWQIAAPQLPPHVGRRRLLDFVRWTELQEPEAVKKALFASLHKQLEAIRQKDIQK